MPILDTTTVVTNPDPITPDRKLYTSPEFKTSTLFNEDRELNNIIQYVEGGKWTVDFFQQVREINTPGQLPDINVSSTVLSYNRINKLILNISTPIDQTDPNNVTGSCDINAGFLPSYGDAFIATLVGGREALFVITLVEKKMFSLHDMYTVEFKLYEFFDKNSEMYRDLLLKVVKEYTYDINHVADKSAPIILNKDYKDKLDLKRVRADIIDHFFRTNVNKEKNIIALPTTVNTYFMDTLLNEFIFKTLGYTGYPNSSKLNRFNVPDITEYSIYDLLLERNISRLSTIDRNLGFTYIPLDNSMPVARQIGWLGIDYIVNKVSDAALIIDHTSYIATNTLTKPTGFVEPLGVRDSNYIFSNAFYTQDIVNCGLMEKVVLQFLRNEVIDQTNLQTLVDQYLYWDVIDQYYLLPILALMLQDKINFTFSAV